MAVSLVMTLIGDDRPGLVESVSAAVARHGGSWQESRMARLGGKFAGILRVEVPQDRTGALEAELSTLASKGLRILIESGHPEAVSGTQAQLELVGQDRPGIVREIAQALAQRSVNIEELETESVEAPMSGGRLFKALAQVRLQQGADLDELRQALEAVANDLMVDISLEDAQEPPRG